MEDLNPNLELFEAAVEIVVVMIFCRLLFAWDERRMTDEQRARAWPTSTRGLVVCSPLFFPLWLVGVPLHFLRTRRSLRGVGEALLAVLALFLLLLAIGTAFESLGGAD